MKINSLTLENIGPFINPFKFDLKTDEAHNIILIGGKNGSGKTTILKAIKFGLFGSYALGFKTESQTYLDEIRNLLNLQEDSNKHSIKVEFSYIENYEVVNCQIDRIWIFNHNEIEERCTVFVNETELNFELQHDFFEKIRSIISPKIVDSIIFDGEKIGRIIDDNLISDFLKGTFETIFNIKVLEQLNLDLLSYTSSRSKKINNSYEIDSLEVLSQIKVESKRLFELKNDQNKLKSRLKEITTSKKSLSKIFKDLGGLSEKEKYDLDKLLTHEIKLKEDFNRKFKHFLENEITFFLNQKLIKNSISRIKIEMPILYEKQLSEMNKELKIKELELIALTLNQKNSKIKPIHNLNQKDYEFIKIKYSERNLWLSLVKSFVTERETNNSRLSELKEKSLSNDNFKKLEYYMNEIQITEKNLLDYNKLIFDSENQITEQTKKLEELRERYDSLNLVIKKINTYDNSFIFSMKAIEINNKFIRHLSDFYKNKVSITATKTFNDVMRKEGFISELRIDENFNMHLYDNFRKEIDSQILSAGEKQLLVSSLIYSMVKVSKRELFFVFDTPLARLDKQNRKNFISQIIKKISEQSIVLSTDSEFVDNFFDLIDSSIAKKYKLDYQDDLRKSIVNEGYFLENLNE